MARKIEKLLALIMCLLLVVSLLPVSAFAEEEENVTAEPVENVEELENNENSPENPENNEGEGETVDAEFVASVEALVNEANALWAAQDPEGAVEKFLAAEDAISAYEGNDATVTAARDVEETKLDPAIAAYYMDGTSAYDVVAKCNGVEYQSLDDAINNAPDGGTIEIVKTGSYTVKGSDKYLTFKNGLPSTVGRPTFDYVNETGNFGTFEKGAAFEGIMFQFPDNKDYVGFYKSGKLTFNHCELNGKFFSYGDMEFNSCGMANYNTDYIMWCYAGNITYNDCSFTSMGGKFLNVYNEGNTSTPWVITLNECYFENFGSANKAAVNVKETSSNSSGTTFLKYDVRINKCEYYGGFPAPSESDTKKVFNPLVQVDARSSAEPTGIKIVQDGDKLYGLDPVAEVNGTTFYPTLAAAVAAANSGDTVTLLADASGDGVVFPSNKDLTVDFGGFTYTIDGTTVGSPNTQTNGFQLLKDSSITLKNGSIASSKAKLLIQNYANLTLDSVNLSGGTSLALSVNNGAVSLTGSTSVTGGMDCSWWPGSYPNGTQITVNTTGSIDKLTVGFYGDGTSIADPSKSTVTLTSGTVGEIAIDADPTHKKYGFSNVTVDDLMAAGAVTNNGATVTAVPTGYEWLNNILTRVFTVTFDADGNKSSEKVIYGKTVLEPTDKPVKTGFHFVAWQVNGTDFDFTTPIKADITITAGFEAHNMVVQARVEPTCTADGLTEGKYCTGCTTQTVAQQTIPALGHSWAEQEPATLTDSLKRVCNTCGSKEEIAYVGITEEWDYLGGEAHKDYPTGMRVYTVYADGSKREVTKLRNLLNYKGTSVRLSDPKGIRIITEMDRALRDELVNNGISGYKLVEYGTAAMMKSAYDAGGQFYLGAADVASGYAFSSDAGKNTVYAESNGKLQYTNSLTGYRDDQVVPDILMRSYAKFSDANGNAFIIYGGIINRSIQYIAQQNLGSYSAGSAEYAYLRGLAER